MLGVRQQLLSKETERVYFQEAKKWEGTVRQESRENTEQGKKRE